METNVDPSFLIDCVEASHLAATSASSVSSRSPNDTVASPMADDEHLRQLLASYPAAITDFFGSGTPCIYKTGPAWPVARSNARMLVRASRPYYNPKKASIWPQVLQSIVAFLDSLEAQVQWNAIDPLAYANAGEAALLCNFVVVISVKPYTLGYEDAVTAAPGVIAILENAGFSNAQVAFVEAVYRRHQMKFMGFDPNSELESISTLRKPFTPSLGLSIAPHDTPDCEGSGGVFLRLSSDPSDQRVFLLTCAHVVHPPREFRNRAYTREKASQPREDVVLLGTRTYERSVNDIMKLIGEEMIAIGTWESSLGRIPAQTADELSSRTDRRQDLTNLVAKAKKHITAADELHTSATKYYTFPDDRILGFVYHCAEIGVGKDGYMYDWALIQLDMNKLEAESFLGNKLFVGGNKTGVDWARYMFAQDHDSQDYHIPKDLLLQLQDYVREDEFHDPQNYDIHNVKTLLAVKNGRTTGTTFGRVNGLESITRGYPDHGLKVDAFEILVLGYDTKAGKNDRFSDEGDSGAMAVDRLGRLIGLVTGGGGPTDATDKTYITPYHKLKMQIEAVFEECHLLPPCFPVASMSASSGRSASYLSRDFIHSLAIKTNIDSDFLIDCIEASHLAVTSASSVSSRSPNDTVASPMADNKHLRQLLASYPAAVTDFFGSGTPCIYKTGPAWPVARANAQKLVRASRPYHNPKKGPIWFQVLQSIVAFLDSLEAQVQWNAVDPLAYANAGEAALFCDFIVVISVKPSTLAYDDAVAAAPGIIAILENAGFSDAQVAFVEAVYRRHQWGSAAALVQHAEAKSAGRVAS